MTTAYLAPQPVPQFFDNNGEPLNGGLLYTYAAGTSTPQLTYTDSTGGTPNANPIVLDAYGRCQYWLDPALSYKLVLKDSLLNIIWTGDHVQGSAPAIFMSTLAASTGAGLIGWIQAGAGAVFRWVRDKLREQYVTPQDFGAVADGTTDDTVAIQAAINTGKAVRLIGNYKITAQLNLSTKNQQIFGDGLQTSALIVAGPSASFSAGILNISSGETGPQLSNFAISLAQPDTAVRASLNAYPPVVYINATPRTQMQNVKICGGIDGVYMYGNCGGFRGYGMDLACFGRNIYIDGNLDVTSFTDCQIWPFTLTGILSTNLQSIFYDASCYGIYSLRNDYLDWKGGLFLCGRAAVFGTGSFPSYPGSTYGAFTSTGFDTYGGLEVSAGNILTDNCTFSVAGGGTNNKNAILHTGGVVMMRGSKVFCGAANALNNALVYSSSSAQDAALVVSNVSFELGSRDQSAVFVTNTSDANLKLLIQGNSFSRTGTGAYTTAIVDIGGGSGAIIGNAMLPNISATGTLDWLRVRTGVGPLQTAANSNYNWTATVDGATVASASVLTIPAVFGDAGRIISITGTTTINAMTYAIVGDTAPNAGPIVTLEFGASLTVNSGTPGSSGAIILNGRSSLTFANHDMLTLQLHSDTSWYEVGRCRA